MDRHFITYVKTKGAIADIKNKSREVVKEHKAIKRHIKEVEEKSNSRGEARNFDREFAVNIC